MAIHHPEQLWWPDAGLRKRDAIEYYHRSVAPVMLPHSTVLDRLARHGDLFGPALQNKQRLP